MYLQAVVQLFVVYACIWWMTGAYHILPFVIGVGNASATLECNTTVIIQCKATFLVIWTIEYNIKKNSSLSASCVSGSPCEVKNNFSGRYFYDYDSNTEISNLTINHVISEDDSRQYKCNDDVFNATVVALPNFSTIKVNVYNVGDIVNITVMTSCIYPAHKVSITWYYMTENGTRIEDRSASTTGIMCLEKLDECTFANKSEYLTNNLILRIQPTSNRSVSDGEMRNYTVKINYDPIDSRDTGSFERNIGTYMVAVIQSTNTVTGSGLAVSDIIALSAAIPSCTIAIVILVIVIVRCMRDRRIKASDAPGTPVGFELVRDSVTEVSAAFRCIPKPYQPGKQEIILFCQQANGNHIANTTQIIEDAGAGTIILNINNLKQGCLYDCCVFARGNNIPSENSDQIRIMTLGLPDAPTDFRVVRVENNYINLSWIPGHYRMNKQRFVLELMDMKNGNITVETIRMSHVIPLMHTVEPLPAGTTFIINLRAENDVGCSEVVGPIEVTTTGNPEPPSELKEAGVTSTSITISWRPGTYRRQTQYFVIEYGRKKKKLENIKWKQKKKVDDDQTVMMHTLANLKSGTTYVVVIFARNDIGESKRTVPLLAKTKEENLDNKP